MPVFRISILFLYLPIRYYVKMVKFGVERNLQLPTGMYGRITVQAGSHKVHFPDQDMPGMWGDMGHQPCADHPFLFLERTTHALVCMHVISATNVGFRTHGERPERRDVPVAKFYLLQVFGVESLNEDVLEG